MDQVRAQPTDARQRVGWWIALLWFLFVNFAFYTRLFTQRISEVMVLWQQVMQVMQ